MTKVLKSPGCLCLMRLEARYFMLKEILGRTEIPTLDEIPDTQAVKMDLETHKYPSLLRWIIPNTDIVISRVQEGDREGAYLFSTETIARIPEFYKKVKNLPYKSNEFVTRDYFNFYISTPGHLMPPKWSRYLPKWSYKMYFSHTIYQWVAFILLIITSIFIIKLFYILLIHRVQQFSSSIRIWAKVLYFVLMVLLIDSLYFLNKLINLTEEVFIIYTMAFEVIGWIVAAFLAFHLVNAIASTILTSSKVDKIGIEKTYTRAIFAVLAFFCAASVLVYGLTRVGVSILPLLTGVGIGGLAIALAARSTIENVIASFTLFAEKLYQVGDRIKVMGHDGTIEGIGIRSTQLRLLSGPLVSIPNEKMVAVEIEKIQRRPFIRREFDITITYDTSHEMINKSLEIVRDILSIHDTIDNEVHSNEAINKPNYLPQVHLNKLNNDSLNIYVSYWYFPPNWWENMQHAENVNLQIIERFNAKGIEFAFPTQTLHWAKKSVKTDNLKEN